MIHLQFTLPPNATFCHLYEVKETCICKLLCQNPNQHTHLCGYRIVLSFLDTSTHPPNHSRTT